MEGQGWVGGWSPGIGDPSFVGWFTVFAYLFASFLCLRAFKLQKQTPEQASGLGAYIEAIRSHFKAMKRIKESLSAIPPRARVAGVWLALAGLFFLLGINKQLDLQTLLTESAKQLAHHQGWYEHRRALQVVFILVFLIVSGLAVVALVLLAKDHLRELRLALCGTIFVLCFVGIRASSFHRVDIFLGSYLSGVKFNWLLELTGIFIVIWAALRPARSAQRT